MNGNTATSPLPTQKKKTIFKFDDWEVEDIRPPMTEEEFVDFCLLNPNLKIEQDKHGNITIMSPVSYDSGNHESEVIIDLGLWNRQTKLGKTFSSSTMFVLPSGEKRMPDAAWVSLEKHKQLSKWQRKQFAHIVPDFVIEVRSPSDNIQDLKNKMSDVWIANGVRLAWLIDVESETVWIYRPNSLEEEITGFDNQLSGEKVLPGFVFDLGVLKEN